MTDFGSLVPMFLQLAKSGQSFIAAPDDPLWKDAVEMSGTGDGGVWVLSWHSPRV